jgi:pimeloyl-ACP methyl ester carboxylesterase
MLSAAEPDVIKLRANGLDHRVLAWEPPAWGATVMLLHGFMDAAGSFSTIAPALRDAGLRVLAPDMRGFGEGPRAPSGSYYHFPDYVADVAAIVDALVQATPLFLVGHSMGGTVATLYTGAFPDRVQKLALLEGVGPPDSDFDTLPDRMRRWIEQVRAVEERGGVDKAVGTIDDAYRRLAGYHPGIDEKVLRAQLVHVSRDLGDGRVAWRADPLHRTSSPTSFFARGYLAFAKRVSCPVLYVSGGPTGFHLDDEEVRLAAFKRLERRTIEGAGHSMHWTKPAEIAEALVAFWKSDG